MRISDWSSDVCSSDLLALGRVPLLLPRRFHVAWHDRVDANVVAPEIAREAAGQARDGGLGGLVQHEIGQGEVPADRTEIKDNPAAAFAHCKIGRAHV